MKYLCVKKGDKCQFGIGNSIEEAMVDYFESDDLDMSQMDWYQLAPVKLTMNVELIKPTITKAKK